MVNVRSEQYKLAKRAVDSAENPDEAEEIQTAKDWAQSAVAKNQEKREENKDSEAAESAREAGREKTVTINLLSTRNVEDAVDEAEALAILEAQAAKRRRSDDRLNSYCKTTVARIVKTLPLVKLPLIRVRKTNDGVYILVIGRFSRKLPKDKLKLAIEGNTIVLEKFVHDFVRNPVIMTEGVFFLERASCWQKF